MNDQGHPATAGHQQGPDLGSTDNLVSKPDANSHTIPTRPKQTSDVDSPRLQQNADQQQELMDNHRVGGDSDVGSEGAYGEITNLPPPSQPSKKKKRKKNKPASKRGAGKPTGFEDFYADTPMTPEQHVEEQELYDKNLHFIDRLLTAIARFERTRKMSNERRDILYKYLRYGDVQCGQKDFQGGQDIKDMDKSTVASILTMASVTEEKRNLGTATSLYAVDFLGCMKGFLSRHAAALYGFNERSEVERVTSTLERFMDYLLQHDVCPEYQADILKTRNFCRNTATSELWSVAEASRRLPGDFNVACSTLFGGHYAKHYDGDSWWGPADSNENIFVGLKPEEASQILHFGIAGAASEDVFGPYLEAVNGDKTLEVVSVEEGIGFEITKIVPPTPECKALYTQNSRHFRPVGRIYAKPWKNPEVPPEDLTEEEREREALAEETNRSTSTSKDGAHATEKPEQYIFFIESIIQQDLRVGMKLEATVHTLNCGLMFFDEVITLFPTFDTYLPNEAMAGYQRPRPLKGAFDYVEDEEEEEEEAHGSNDGSAANEDKDEDGGVGVYVGGGGGGGAGYVDDDDDVDGDHEL